MSHKISYNHKTHVRFVGKQFLDRNGNWMRADKVFLLPEDPPHGPGENDVLIACRDDEDTTDVQDIYDRGCGYCSGDVTHTQSLHMLRTGLKQSGSDRI